MIPEDANNSRIFALSEEVNRLRAEVAQLRSDYKNLKRAILNVPDIGEKVQKKLWE